MNNVQIFSAGLFYESYISTAIGDRKMPECACSGYFQRILDHEYGTLTQKDYSKRLDKAKRQLLKAQDIYVAKWKLAKEDKEFLMIKRGQIANADSGKELYHIIEECNRVLHPRNEEDEFFSEFE